MKFHHHSSESRPIYPPDDKAAYFKLPPSMPQYHKVMKLAKRLEIKWQDVIRVAIDNFVDGFPEDYNPKKNR